MWRAPDTIYMALVFLRFRLEGRQTNKRLLVRLRVGERQYEESKTRKHVKVCEIAKKKQNEGKHTTHKMRPPGEAAKTRQIDTLSRLHASSGYLLGEKKSLNRAVCPKLIQFYTQRK